MVEFLAAGSVLVVLLFSIIQFALLWASQGAVETAAHFAARKFALSARIDTRKAREAALAEASSLCRHRPGGRAASASLTSLDFSRGDGGGQSSGARSGDAYRVRVTHWVELVVPWVDRILFAVAPVRKTAIGGKYYLVLGATRWVTVE